MRNWDQERLSNLFKASSIVHKIFEQGGMCNQTLYDVCQTLSHIVIELGVNYSLIFKQQLGLTLLIEE